MSNKTSAINVLAAGVIMVVGNISLMPRTLGCCRIGVRSPLGFADVDDLPICYSLVQCFFKHKYPKKIKVFLRSGDEFRVFLRY